MCSIPDSVLLKFLGLSHPAIDTRDIASFVPFRKSLGYKSSQMIPLKILVNKLMGRDIGYGYEHPVSMTSSTISRTIAGQKCSLIFCSCSAGDRPCLLGLVSFSDTLGGSNSARPMAVHHRRRCSGSSPSLFHLESLHFRRLHSLHGLFLSRIAIGLIDTIITSYMSHARISSYRLALSVYFPQLAPLSINQIYERTVSGKDKESCRLKFMRSMTTQKESIT